MLRKFVSCCFLILLTVSSHVSAQLPERKADLRILLKESQTGLVVDSVLRNTSLTDSGIKKGDVLSTINGKIVITIAQYNKAINDIRTNDVVEVRYVRKGKSFSKKVKAIARPHVTSAIADVLYDWVKFREGYLRTITYKPKDKSNLPAILLIPGYGCGSIENYAASYNGKLINEWVKAGYAVVTIEKSGTGDSDRCAPCTEVDLKTDIESFDAGYAFMEQLSFVDKSNLFIWGHSIGGTIAPEVAKRHTPKGVMVFASVFRPWNEFLLEMHRVQKPLMEGFTLQQTEKFVREIQPLYSAFFNEKKSVQALIADARFTNQAKKELGYQEGSNDMWGRHWRFWQQLDSLNLAESWSQVNCPVLVLHGTADYEQCSPLEPMLITQTVNETHPGHATQITMEGIDHFMMNSQNWKEAYEHFKNQEYLKGNFNYRIVNETVNWLSGLRR